MSSLPLELGVLQLLEVAVQTGLCSCPLPGADAGPVSPYTYMIRGLGVGIGKALWKARVDGGSLHKVVVGGVIGASGVKLDTTCGVGHYLTKIHGLLVELILTSPSRLLTKSAVTVS